MTALVVKGYTAKKHTFFIPAGTKKLPRTLIDRTDQPECSIPTADLIEYVKTLLPNVRSHRRAPTNTCKAQRFRARPSGLRCWVAR